MLLFALVLFILGLQDEVVDTLAGPAATVFGHLGLAYSLAIGVDVFFMAVIYLLERFVGRLKGVEIVYDQPGSSS